jgi:hypothetical protein
MTITPKRLEEVCGSKIEKQDFVANEQLRCGALNVNAWNKLTLSPYLRSIASEGVHFPFNKEPRRICKENYVSEENIVDVDIKWKEWKEKGVIEEGEVMLIMALGTVPKKNKKIRTIHDCRPINEHVPNMLHSLDGIAEVAKFIKTGDWLCSIDLKDGYEHISIHQSWRKYFGVKWKGEVMRFARLGFGFKLSPVIFQGLMNAVVTEANSRMGGLFYSVYLDDFLIRGNTKKETNKACQKLIELLKELGLVLNLEKSMLEPCQQLEYLGKVWNSANGKVWNCNTKVQSVINECKMLLTVGRTTLNELESLLGKMEWLARTMKFARCWKRSLLVELKWWKELIRDEGGGLGVRGQGCVGSVETPKRISKASKLELKWWKKNATNWIPMELEDVWKTTTTNIHSDACDYGYGATNGLWGLWNGEEVNWMIAIKELEAVRRTIGRVENGTRVRIGCDNTVAYWTLKKGRSFCLELNNLIKRIGGDVHARKIDVDFYWLKSEDNMADWISRSWERPQLTGYLRIRGN